MNQQKMIVWGIAAFALLLVVWNSVFTVRQQEQAMIVGAGPCGAAGGCAGDCM